MKEKLKSFKVASGQKLGEKLVVEVIKFSEANEFVYSELDQPDIFPYFQLHLNLSNTAAKEILKMNKYSFLLTA